MRRDPIRNRVEHLLALADVVINGGRPWDLQVHDERLYARVMAEGSLGLGESYMDGWWDCERLDEFFHRVLRVGLDTRVSVWKDALRILRAKLVNLQKPTRASHIGRHHYDLGNDFFRRMLDERMIYSCAYWRNAATLDEAQEHKLDLVCRKLELRPGMRLLDIGCGWGGTVAFAAERYGVSALGITVSAEQATYARERCEGLDVEIRLQDYRAIQGTFDRVLSLGMFEHVGYKNYGTFMQLVRDHLVDEGLFLLHTIGGDRSVTTSNPWTTRYIFPNSMLPSARQLSAALEGKFVIEDWHNFGADYDETLMHWYRNFERQWPTLSDRYDERFHRMWRYFLLSSAGGFRARRTHVWQLVLSPRGVPSGYRAPR
ncbi:MAG: cyclopropane fatty acyl phospholipid synthase [Gemmatimonadales bacterium]|jgi:cyclopropane-fatty-acyl-phospholipid synthase